MFQIGDTVEVDIPVTKGMVYVNFALANPDEVVVPEGARGVIVGMNGVFENLYGLLGFDTLVTIDGVEWPMNSRWLSLVRRYGERGE